MADTHDPLAAEFDALMARAGLTIPAAQWTAVLPGYAELRQQVELLRGLPASAEPSNIFRLHPIKVA